MNLPLRPILGVAGITVGLIGITRSIQADIFHSTDEPVSFSTAHTKQPDEKVVLVAETKLDPVTFSLNSFGGKYRIVRVEVKNLTDERIDLDPAQDRFVARVGRDKVVTGVLSLVAADGATWDKIDERRRKSLAYPKTLDRRARITIYAFFPADELIDLPLGFEWSVGDGNRSFHLTRAAVAAK
jgi:hypothetical protein